MKTVNICGHVFTLKQVQMDEDFADIDVIESVIRLNEALTLKRKGEALYHEAGHSYAPTLSDTPFGHALWDALSASGWQFLCDNNLVNWDVLAKLTEDNAVY